MPGPDAARHRSERPPGPPAPAKGAPHVVVVGAGAFGGWVALWLCRRGARVTLLDAWGPGNARASSGGETRVLRGMYGRDALYTEWVARALDLWVEAESAWGQRLYRPTGVLWMFSGDDGYARASLPCLAAAGLSAVELAVSAAAARFPQISFDGVSSVFYEERAGYLFARRACRAVAAAVAAGGGEVREAAVRPAAIAGGRAGGGSGEMSALTLSDGSRLGADQYVFACGPWLGELFPDVLGTRLNVTRQEIFYFGTPADGGARFGEAAMPVWMDLGGRVFYGIPGNEARGFKIADDSRGEIFDPTHGDRLPSAADLDRARRHLARRFPGMAGAPLLESRVCQYESTPDAQLLVDRHPQAGNVWLVGGGSGHGFKLGPALGEYAAELILGGGKPRAELSLARFDSLAAAAPISQFKSGAGHPGGGPSRPCAGDPADAGGPGSLGAGRS
ncbi:MAG: FAD-dependent oxidoreductase [Acidobacteria bacterium]|nr:FAD-dependent oxidoreductase [Acidobacteriota bacterium]